MKGSRSPVLRLWIALSPGVPGWLRTGVVDFVARTCGRLPATGFFSVSSGTGYLNVEVDRP